MANQIGRITTGGAITEYVVPTTNSGPQDITAGPDGALWFTEYNGNNIGRIAPPSTGNPQYGVCLLYDSAIAKKSGSTIPIKLQLCDSSGNNLSSPNITLHATSITQTSTSISGLVQESGNANPDNDFRFDSTLGTSGGYTFNLNTHGITTGTYDLNFTVTGDSFVYAAMFQVK